MKKPTKINSVLEKKLEELEYLRELLIFDDDDPNVYRDIELRIIFAKTLLAAEISSRPMDIEGEEVSEERLKLACMAKRLHELDEAFRTNQFSGHNDESLETNDGVDDGETGSVHSWVKSCQDQFGKAEEEKEVEEEEGEEDAEQWSLFQDASSEEKKEVRFPAAAVKEQVVLRELKEKRRFGFRDLVCFGLIGLVSGMIILLGYIDDITKDDDFFLTPT